MQSASRYASVRDVEAATERFAGSEVIEAHRRLWGPVLDDVAFATGALAPASSVLIRPAGASQLESAAVRAMALFPADVFPSAEDTADTLAARLGGSGFLDDIHFKKGGHGKRRWRSTSRSAASLGARRGQWWWTPRRTRLCSLHTLSMAGNRRTGDHLPCRWKSSSCSYWCGGWRCRTSVHCQERRHRRRCR